MVDLGIRHAASNRPLYVVSLNHFINDGSTYLIASLFPAMELAFGLDIFQIGLLVGAGYIINVVFQPLTGRLAQVHSPRILFAAGISLIATSMLLFAEANSFLVLLASALILRLGSSFYHPIGASVISRAYMVEKLDFAMGFQSAFGNLGVVVAFLTSAPVYLALGWKGPFLIYAAVEGVTVVVTLLALGIQGRVQPDSAQQPYRLTAGHLRAGAAAERHIPDRSQKKKLQGLPVFFVVVSLVSGGANAVFSNFGNLLLFHDGYTFTLSNEMMTLWFCSAFAGAILSGFLARRIQRLNLLSISFLLAGIGSLVFALESGLVLVSVLVLISTGFMLSITYPATYSELADYVGPGKGKEGTSYGFLFSSQITGSAVLGFVAGYLAGGYGLSAAFLISALLLICSVPCIMLWKGVKPGIPAQGLA